MRYIKLFENFGNMTKVRDNINACLVELTDQGFEVNVAFVEDKYINVELIKDYDSEDFLHHSEDFQLEDVEDEVTQLVEYVCDTYSDKFLRIEYIPETRFDNKTYTSLEEIPRGLDLIRFDVYFYFENIDKNLKSYENFEPDKDWGVISNGSSNINRHHFDGGFLSDEEALKERVRNIFIELEDTNHHVTITIDKLSIMVHIDPIIKDQINNEVVESSLDYDLTKECCENFVEYIKERNPNIDSRVGLNVKYTYEYYEMVHGVPHENSTFKNWKREISENFPPVELRKSITELKVRISV